MLIDGETYIPEKFAPMGSALCFPTQTTIFSSIVILAYMLVDTLNEMPVDFFHALDSKISNIRSFLKERVYLEPTMETMKFQPFTVYGDDIICDSKVTKYVISMLELLGFKPNNEKSFTGTASLRESCGKYYIDGYDVTPIQFTIKDTPGSKGTIQPHTYASFVSMINKAGDKGFKALHSHFIGRLRLLCDKANIKLGFTDKRDDSSKIYTKNPHSRRALKAQGYAIRVSQYWDTDLCEPDEFEVRIPIPRVENKNHHDTEKYGYLQSMRTAYREANALVEQEYLRYDPVNTRWGWTWTPIPN